MDVVAGLALALAAILLEHRLKDFQLVCFRAEMGEVVVALLLLLRDLFLHAGAVITVKCIALDEGGSHAFTVEDFAKRVLDRRCAGARGTRDRDDGMLVATFFLIFLVQARNRPRFVNSGWRVPIAEGLVR
jgi:hypothetical protein